MRNFEYTDADRSVFEKELADSLPETIIDNHIHLWLKEHIAIDETTYSEHQGYKPWTDFQYLDSFSFDDFVRVAETSFPSKTYQGCFFGLPFPIVDITKANEYVVQLSRSQKVGYFYITTPGEDASLVEKKFGLSDDANLIGFKPYPDLVQNKDDVGIFDMISRDMLDYADSHGLTILLHIPRKGRLRDPRNIREITDLIRTYKNIAVILAHIGRSFCPCDFEGYAEPILKLDRVFFDTSMVNEFQVFDLVFRHVASDRIIFGSDAPLAFMKGKDVCINNTHYYVTNRAAPWGLGPTDPSRVAFTLFVYEEMRSIIAALKSVYGAAYRKHAERIFYRNMQSLLVHQ